MIDTHAHLNFQAFEKDCAQVIERSFSNGIKFIINVGSQLDTSSKAIELADKFKNLPPHLISTGIFGIKLTNSAPIRCGGLYAAVGLHPIHAGDEVFDFEIYKKLTQNKKVVAIGETGLDYFHIKDEKLIKLQKEIFLSHIKLAQELDLPLILHCRGIKKEPNKAYQEMLEILKKERANKGVIHCFSSNLDIAKEFLALGFYIGFTGITTFSKELENVVSGIPLDKILTETDCPYLAPVPYRGKRCEPWHVKFTIEKIAQIKGLSFPETEKQTEQNAINLFGLKD